MQKEVISQFKLHQRHKKGRDLVKNLESQLLESEKKLRAQMTALENDHHIHIHEYARKEARRLERVP